MRNFYYFAGGLLFCLLIVNVVYFDIFAATIARKI